MGILDRCFLLEGPAGRRPHADNRDCSTSGVRHGFVAVTTSGHWHQSWQGSWSSVFKNPDRVVTGFSAARKISLREVQPAGSNYLREHAGIAVFSIGGTTVSQRFCEFLTFARTSSSTWTVITTTSTHRWGSCFRHPPGGAASCESSDPPSQTIDVGAKIVAVRPPR